MDYKYVLLTRDQIVTLYKALNTSLEVGRAAISKILFSVESEWQSRNEFFIDFEVKLLEFCYGQHYSAEKTLIMMNISNFVLQESLAKKMTSLDSYDLFDSYLKRSPTSEEVEFTENLKEDE